MLVDDLHFQIDNHIVIQADPDIQNKGFVINGIPKFNGIGDYGRGNIRPCAP